MIWLENVLGTSVINALSLTMLHSLWQGSLLAFILALALRQIPEEQSHMRYELSASALFLILITSLITFIVCLDHTSNGDHLTMPSDMGYARASNYLSPISHYSVGIWFLGVLLLGARLIFGFTHLARLRYETHRETSIDESILQKLRSRIRLHKSIQIFESALVTVPATIGYFKPIILMPIGMAMHLTTYQLEAIIAHELAHIKRSDFLLNLFYSIVEILFYYHPAVWWISAQIRHEREANCDDIAIRITGSKENYLQALLSIHSSAKSLPLAMSALGHSRSLYKRIKRQILLKKDNSYTMEKVTALTLVVLAVVGLSFTADSQTKADKPQSKSQEIEVIETKSSSKDKNKRKSKIKSKINGQRYEMEKEDDQITLLKINGKKIDPQDYSKHTNLINHLEEGQDVALRDLSIDIEEHEDMIKEQLELEMELQEEIKEERELEIEQHIEKELGRAMEDIHEKDLSFSHPSIIREHIIINRSDLIDEEFRERVDRQFRDAERQLERTRERFRDMQDRGVMNDELKIKLDLQRRSLEKEHEKMMHKGEKMKEYNKLNRQHLEELEKMQNMQLRESRERVRESIEKRIQKSESDLEEHTIPNRGEIRNLERINEQLRGEMDQLKKEMEKIRNQIDKISEHGNSSVPIEDQNSKSARNIGSLVPFPNYDLAEAQTKSISVASNHSQSFAVPTTTLNGYSQSK